MRCISDFTNSFKNQAFSGLASLIKLLPTGTMFAYQFLNPLLLNTTAKGARCEPVNKTLSATFAALCGLSWFFDSFTDSYVDNDGVTHYGITTLKGLYPSPNKNVDVSSYEIKVGDFVHGVFSMLVFSVVALLSDDTVACFYPEFEEKKSIVMRIVPAVVGAASSVVFFLFPTKRHYIGYPSSSSSEDKRVL